MLFRSGDNVMVRTDGTKGTVQSVNVLRQLVKILTTGDDGTPDIREYPVKDIKFKQKRRRDHPQ